MTTLQLAARNVSAALRDSMKAQHALMVLMRQKFPIDWEALKAQSPGNERLLRDIVAAVEYLGTVSGNLNEEIVMSRIASQIADEINFGIIKEGISKVVRDETAGAPGTPDIPPME